MSGGQNVNTRRPRGQSLTVKLVAGQIWRIASVLIALDIIICVMASVILWRVAENNIADIVKNYDRDTKSEYIGKDCTVTETMEAGGFKIPDFIPFLPDNPKSGTRDIDFFIYFGNPFAEKSEYLSYDAYVPLEKDGLYILISQDLSGHVYYFRIFMSLLIIFEILLLALNIGKSRIRIKRALRPISDLAQTARNISAEPPRQPSGKIHVEGAIDALNTINVNRLDTRIKIADEREELRGLASAINAMLDRLDEAYKSQLRFVSDASHELRTPIAVIQGYANLLDRWGKDDPQALSESINAIKSEAAGMKNLIEQLLFLARGDNDSIVLNFETTDCTELLKDVLRETEMIDPGHEIHGDIEDGLSVYGDAQLIKQAIRIFLDNSIKYTPPSEKISISGARDGEYVKISVADNGIGISDEDLPNVFDRFFRSDESRARTTGGTGLGLSIAKWIIDRHEGHIELLSRAEFGTKVVLRIPEKGKI